MSSILGPQLRRVCTNILARALSMNRRILFRPYPRFITFAERFYATVSKEFDFPVSQQEFADGLRSMSMDAYVQGLPDYNEALQGKDGKFQFVQPMIILCGMNFLQNALLPNIQKNVN